ncbi:hypothetical protein L2E82_16097 [Cichorium intybus]|uniref:Uncharacterized protein n=1 Tax=Cichorium intybus TaxID=13427 RepID=A0ACB9F491_CICIN|nr:hypothetical protein L2E82_16097 [Cichorium intybus]
MNPNEDDENVQDVKHDVQDRCSDYDSEFERAASKLKADGYVAGECLIGLTKQFDASKFPTGLMVDHLFQLPVMDRPVPPLSLLVPGNMRCIHRMATLHPSRGDPPVVHNNGGSWSLKFCKLKRA